MARVLILSLVFRPDNVSTAQIMGDLALDLKEKGHEIFIITTVPHYNEDAEALGRQPLHPYWGKLLQKSRYSGMDVLHVWMPRKGKSKVLRLTAWLGFHAISTFAGLITGFRSDIILTPSPPLTIGISAWLLGLRHNCPFIYNVQEIYPDVAVDLGMLRNKSLIRYLQRMEQFVYRKAAALAVISESMVDRIRAKGVPEEKIHLITNFVDVKDFHPLPKINEFSLHHNLHDKFVISYAGNMGKPQGLEAFIEAAHLLREEKGIHFLMMGDGSERDSLIEQSKRLKLTNITILPQQPYSLMVEAYAAADASFVSQAPGTSSDGIPSKVYRIMACARPVIAYTDLDSDLAKLIMKAHGGIVVKSGDVTSLADAIKDAYRQGDAWCERGSSGRKVILEEFSRSSISNLYNELILNCIKNRSGNS